MTFSEPSQAPSLASPAAFSPLARLTASWYGERPWAPLRPLGALYAWGAGWRRWLYDLSSKAVKVEAPVICLGNLSVGGSGKTPLCLSLADLLAARGWSPAIVSRGYGGRRNKAGPLVVCRGRGPEAGPELCGDEPWLMAFLRPSYPVVVHSRRAEAAALALRELGANIIILDDGFQHLALQMDCRVLLLPAHRPFGNGAALPAGPLRESVKAHKLAHILVSTGAAEPSELALDLAGGRPLFAASYRAAGWSEIDGRDRLEPQALAGRRVYAFCGLGRPDGFRRSLESLNVDIVRFRALRDHEPYAPAMVEALNRDFLDSGAELMLTTAKDSVKLKRARLAGPLKILWVDLVLDRPEQFTEAVLNQAGGVKL